MELDEHLIQVFFHPESVVGIVAGSSTYKHTFHYRLLAALLSGEIKPVFNVDEHLIPVFFHPGSRRLYNAFLLKRGWDKEIKT